MQKLLILAAAFVLTAAPAAAQTLSGIALGDPLNATKSIGLKPTASNEMGPYSSRRWVFPDGNELAVTARRTDGRIVYLESDWGGRVPGSPTDYPGVKFGMTTLNELRLLMGSNGFSYKSRMMFDVGDGIGTANSFEVAGRPNTIVSFISVVKSNETDQIRSGRRKLGDVAKVDSVVLADADYLAGLWGAEKSADPKAKPVSWGTSAAAASADTASNAVEGFIRALECRKVFAPERVIGALLSEEAINPKPVQIVDGIPSYISREPIQFHGLKIITIEGWSASGRMFRRGPGTAPPTHVGITVVGSEVEVTETLARNGVALAPHVDGKPFLYVSDGSFSDPGLDARYRGRKLSSVVCSVY